MNKSLLERLLDYYHIDYETYLSLNKDVSLVSFRDGHEFDDIESAVKLVKDVIAKKGKIIIYGDYDCDGVMGTSILVKMFEYLDVVVDYYLPNRYLDGYGLNLEHAKEYVKAKYDLVITVDNGITAFEPIKLLHDNGIKVLVLDHHQALEELPLADAICHPIVSHFGETSSSGAFTAFIYSISLLGRVDKYLALLATISVISDMMPLLDYNRSLLRAMFKEYKVGEFMAVDLLADHETLNETVIGMKIAPRINSIGRLVEDSSINQIVRFLVSDDKEFILNYYSYIVDMNEERKNISKIDINYLDLDLDDAAVIIKGEYKEGIIGLIANSIMIKYHKPVVVFATALDGSLKGSARAPEGYDLVEIFQEVSEFLLTSGGHSNAAGCSISSNVFEAFRKKFIEVVSKKEVKKVEHEYIEIKMNELSFENLELINSFSPFGENWPAPIFRLRHIKVDTLMYSRDHKHIVTSLGNKLKLVFFSYPESELANKSFIDIIGTVSEKSFKGSSYLEFSGKEFIDCDF